MCALQWIDARRHGGDVSVMIACSAGWGSGSGRSSHVQEVLTSVMTPSARISSLMREIHSGFLPLKCSVSQESSAMQYSLQHGGSVCILLAAVCSAICDVQYSLQHVCKCILLLAVRSAICDVQCSLQHVCKCILHAAACSAICDVRCSLQHLCNSTW